MEDPYKRLVTYPVDTGMDSRLNETQHRKSQIQEMVAVRMAGLEDDLDCGTWDFFSAFETLVVLKQRR